MKTKKIILSNERPDMNWSQFKQSRLNNHICIVPKEITGLYRTIAKLETQGAYDIKLYQLINNKHAVEFSK